MLSSNPCPYNKESKGCDIELFFNTIHHKENDLNKNLIIQSIIPWEGKGSLSGQAVQEIRAIECTVLHNSRNQTLTQMREVLQNKRVSLKKFESREKELVKAKNVLSRLDKKMTGMFTDVYDTTSNDNELDKQVEMDMSEMSKMAKMRMARNAKMMKKKRKKTAAKRNKTIHSKRTRSQQSCEKNDNGEEEREGKSSVVTESASKRILNPLSFLSTEERQLYNQAKKIEKEASSWRKSASDIRKEIDEVQATIKEMEIKLRDVIADLSSALVQNEKEMRKQMREEVEKEKKQGKGNQSEVDNEWMDEIIDLCVEETFMKKDRHELPYGSNKRWCFQQDYHYLGLSPDNMDDCPYPTSAIEKLLDDVLSIPATEAVCERLFRISSGIARRNYVTNIKATTVRTLTTFY